MSGTSGCSDGVHKRAQHSEYLRGAAALHGVLREFTAMNARPPAIRPAALLLIYASVFFDMVISSFLKVCIDIFCNFRKNIPETMPEIDSSDTWNARKYVLQLRKITFLS